MTSTPGVLTGTIHGKTIAPDEPPGLPDGQQVQVTVERVVPKLHGEELRELLRQAAGTWSDDQEGSDQYLVWNRQQRKAGRREISE